MMKFVREFRLIPVVLLATVSLAALKLLGLLLDGGYILTDLDYTPPERPITVPGKVVAADNKVTMPLPGAAWAQQMLDLPDVNLPELNLPEITGSAAADRQAARNAARNAAKNAEPTGTSPAGTAPVGPSATGSSATGSSAAAQPAAAPPPRGEKPPDGKVIELEAKPAPSASERAILERLQERRQELDSRAREIELRENLLKSAEKKYEAHATEMREQEANSPAALAKEKEAEVARLKNLVTMYENMKAKDAARIFDRLEMRILVEVASQINPRRMSDILGQMSSESAERLTVELANRAITSTDRNADAGNLPKIEGVPKN
jgi:flagellar motility protein MotE (MotC chaperone)